MEIVLLDSDIIIEFLNSNAEAIIFLQNLSSYQLAISVITKAEIIQGAKNKVHQEKLVKGLDDLLTLDIDTSSSQYFTYLFSKYYLSHRCTIPDMLNAAIALSYNIKLLTLNAKDYKFIEDLNLIKHHIKPKKGSFD